MTYQVIHTNGIREPFTPKSKRPTLEEMQAIVGGLIERVNIPGGELWVNEEGLCLSLPINRLASSIANQLIVGDVLLCIRKRRNRA